MISRTHQQCGHILMFCTNCHSTGCDVSHCENCIGNGNYHICKVCGARAVITNFRRNEVLRYRGRENVQLNSDVEYRLNTLEKHNQLQFQSHDRRTHYTGTYSWWKWIGFFAICWAISQVLDHKDFTGILGFILSIVNIAGAIAEIPVAIIKTYFL